MVGLAEILAAASEFATSVAVAALVAAGVEASVEAFVVAVRTSFHDVVVVADVVDYVVASSVGVDGAFVVVASGTAAVENRRRPDFGNNSSEIQNYSNIVVVVATTFDYTVQQLAMHPFEPFDVRNRPNLWAPH